MGTPGGFESFHARTDRKRRQNGEIAAGTAHRLNASPWFPARIPR